MTQSNCTAHDIKTMKENTAPIALVWWSLTHTAWACQIGNDKTLHYNERDAIAHGERLAATLLLGSCIQTD